MQVGYHEERPGHPVEVVINPQEIKLPLAKDETISRIECGQSHSLILTSKGRVLSMGSNAFGQCGRSVIENENYRRSSKNSIGVLVDLDDPGEDAIVNLECGINHSMFVTKLGKVYSCGWGADGQTGLGHYDNQHKVSKVKGDITSEKIVKVACAADCVLALNGIKKNEDSSLQHILTPFTLF